MQGDEMFRLTVDELEKLLSVNRIVGEPIDLGDKVIIGVSMFGFGFGAGSGSNETKKSDGQGTGAGGGISPVALIVLHKNISGPEGIQVFSLRKKSGIAESIGTISETIAPQIVDLIKSYKKKKEDNQ